MKKSVAFLIVFLLFVVKTHLVLAQEEQSSSSDAIMQATYSASVFQDAQTKDPIDYPLPYPGILPDNPLYFLKAIRDRVVSLLISEPIKKAEFDLLQADKRLNAGLYLFDQHPRNEALTESSISKGENYFGEAIQNVENAKKQGINTADIQRKLLLATQKHKEVIKGIKHDASKEMQGKFRILEKRVEEFEKKVTVSPSSL